MQTQCVSLILSTVKNIRLGQELSVLEIQRLLGLMAAAASDIPLGLVQHETSSILAEKQRFPSSELRVMRQGLRALL